MKPLKVLHVLALWLALLPGLALPWPAQASQDRPAHVHFFELSFGDLPEEMQLARAQGKLGLFVMYAAEDCPPCIRMKATILSRPEVQEHFRRHFRVLHIDFNGDSEVVALDGRAMRSKEFAREVARVRGTPTFSVIGLDGKELLRHFGPTRNATEFMWLADYVVAGEHRQRPYEAYRQQRLAAGRR